MRPGLSETASDGLKLDNSHRGPGPVVADGGVVDNPRVPGLVTGPNASSSTFGGNPVASNHVAALLFSLAAIVVTAWLFGAVARKLGQPAVIGEIAGGILMGPTLFGGAISNFLFPSDIRPILGMLAGVGVAIFMFLVGVETEPNAVREQGGTTLAISLTSVVRPLGLGVCLALYLRRNIRRTAG